MELLNNYYIEFYRPWFEAVVCKGWTEVWNGITRPNALRFKHIILTSAEEQANDSVSNAA